VPEHEIENGKLKIEKDRAHAPGLLRRFFNFQFSIFNSLSAEAPIA